MVKTEVKKPAKRGKVVSAKINRMRKLTRKQERTKAKIEAQKRAKIPGSFYLTTQVFSILHRYWKTLGGIVLVYLVLNIVFASGLSNLNANVSDIKNNLDNSTARHTSQFSEALGGFGLLIGSGGASGSQSGSILQSMLIVLESLVIIWALRQLLAGKQVGIKQAYYNSMTPLIPFLLVVFVIILQLLPITIGTAALGVILTSIFGNQALVTIIFSFVFAVLAAWSIYMISSSVFALYIVTLPDMQPRHALRSAANLVRFRRWQLMRRLLFLPIAILAIMAILIIPLILFATVLVAPVFYLLSVASILFVHSYLYSLYRSLLNE